MFQRREHHKDDFKEGLDWALSVLGGPATAAVAASAMSQDDLDEIADALGDPTPGSDDTPAPAR